MKNVLVLGSGGREHALGWKLAQDENVESVCVAPGNEGMMEDVMIEPDVNPNDFKAVEDYIQAEGIDLVVVGPEAPLANGIVDYFNAKGFHNIFGPTKAASALEADKGFSYEVMEKAGVPQARSAVCGSAESAKWNIASLANDKGVVLKAKGLTGGKGVTVYDSKQDAIADAENHFTKFPGDVIVAERLSGQEFSIFGFSDGERVEPIGMSFQDHKQLLDGDKGPMTGGMGAYGPAPIASTTMVMDVVDNMMTPTVKTMKEMGKEFKGFIYAGCMLTENGPKILEYNVRFGDPECQPAMMMMESGLYAPISLALEGKLDEISVRFKPGAACCIVLASNGYPGLYEKGLPISGLEQLAKIENTGQLKIFHAGAKVNPDNSDQLLTAGGRVLGVTGYSNNGILDARQIAYGAAERINIPGGFHYRKDIANKAIDVEK